MTTSHPLGLIKIPGAQAEKFLQGQVTCDMREVNEQPHLAAYCDPKGRVQAIFRIFKYQEDYYLIVLRTLIPQLLNTLQKVAVFFKIKLEDVSDIHPHPALKRCPLPEGEGIKSWELLDIKNGIPTVYPETVGLFTPHQLNLPQLNAVSFTKGCYIGQEIIARMQYLGKLKQQMYRINFNSTQLPTPGCKFVDQAKHEVGELVMAAFANEQEIHALAVLQNSAINQTIYLENSNAPILAVTELIYTSTNSTTS